MTEQRKERLCEVWSMEACPWCKDGVPERVKVPDHTHVPDITGAAHTVKDERCEDCE